jgi:hypothetical protein
MERTKNLRSVHDGVESLHLVLNEGKQRGYDKRDAAFDDGRKLGRTQREQANTTEEEE